MKRSGTITFILSLMLVSASVQSQTPAKTAAAQAAPNIVTVNFNAAVLGTAEAQHDLLALQKKLSSREVQLQKLNDAVEGLSKQLNDPAATKLTESDRSAKMMDLNNKEKQLQREAEDYKNDSQSESQRIFQQIAQKVFTLLQDFSREHDYAAVLERGTDAAPIVWYAASDIDITEQLIKSYNLKSGAPESKLPDGPARAPRPSVAAPK